MKIRKLKDFYYTNLIRIVVIFYFIFFVLLFLPFISLMNLGLGEALLISFLSFFLDRIIDYYSTWKFSKEFDRDFWKYKLNEYYRELSPTLSKHPKLSDILSLKILLINGIVFAIFFGMPILFFHSYVLSTAICLSFLATIPIVYLNNVIIAINLRICKKVAIGKKS